MSGGALILSQAVEKAVVAAVAITENYIGPWVSIQGLDTIFRVVQTTSTIGNDDSFQGKLVMADDDQGNGMVDVPGGLFDEVTKATSPAFQSFAIRTEDCKPFLRFEGTIAGTNPRIRLAVLAYGFYRHRFDNLRGTNNPPMGPQPPEQ